MTENKTVLELISEVDEFLEMHKSFQDPDLDIALSKIVRIIMNPDLNPISATKAIVHLQALSAKLSIQANYAKNVSKPKPGTTEYQKKNMYFSIADSLNELVAALKYVVK